MSSSFQESKKVHVSRDLWPWPWAHPGCTLTWSPSCASLVAIRPFACEKKRFAQKFTDRQTDDGCRAIALAHSWNELKIVNRTVKHCKFLIHNNTLHLCCSAASLSFQVLCQPITTVSRMHNWDLAAIITPARRYCDSSCLLVCVH